MTSSAPNLPRWLVLLLAASVGVVAANLYYAQPLTALISQSLGLKPEAASWVGFSMPALALLYFFTEPRPRA